MAVSIKWCPFCECPYKKNLPLGVFVRVPDLAVFAHFSTALADQRNSRVESRAGPTDSKLND